MMTMPGNGRGCGQATSCTPASDLPAPDPSQGFQIAIPNTLMIQPGQEYYYCYYKSIPSTSNIQIGSFQSWMSTGSSHHFILFEASGPDGQFTGGAVAGSVGGCTPQGTWLYATSTSGQIIELKMPDGVGLPMSAGQQLNFNMHFINAGSMPVVPELKLNVLFAVNATQEAAAMVSFNSGIAVPPMGTQDVTGSCSPPAGSKFFAYTTHTHRHGGSVSTGAYTDVTYNGMPIVHSTDWENPDVGLWGPPNFLTINAGDTIGYDCHFVNTDSTLVTFGETAASNEMCMSIGYYFPAMAQTTAAGVPASPYCN
jgi:hypothetical protein